MFTMNYSKKQMLQVLSLVLCCILFAGMVMLASTTTAFCTDDDILDSINNAFETIATKIYKIMRAVIVPCCIVALGFAAFQFIIGGNQGAEKARKIVIACFCAIAVVVFAPLIIKTIAGVIAEADSNGGDDLGDYNPLYTTKKSS